MLRTDLNHWTKFKIERVEVSESDICPLFVGVATGFNTSAASGTQYKLMLKGSEALLENPQRMFLSRDSLESMGTGEREQQRFYDGPPGSE